MTEVKTERKQNIVYTPLTTGQNSRFIHIDEFAEDIHILSWLVVLGFHATLTAKVISWQSETHMCFLAFSTPALKQLFFSKPPSTFLTCFCRGERRKYAGKKSRLNQGLNSQPQGHEFDTLTTEPPGWGTY